MAKAAKAKPTPTLPPEALPPVISPGDLGSRVKVYTRNPINTSLVNEGVVVKINSTGTRVVRVELNEGGFRDVTCYSEPGPNLDPYWLSA
jgi:hypothetical protein